MVKRSEIIIAWVFILVVGVLSINYIIKYQDTKRALIVTEQELMLSQDSLSRQVDINNGLRYELDIANQTLEDLKSEEYEFVYLGEYKLTYYCDERYSHICGGSGVTASGRPTTVGSTIGVNPKEIPYGSIVYIEGLGFRSADDTGSGIGNKHIDVLVAGHQEALSQTLLNSDVWVLVKKIILTIQN